MQLEYPLALIFIMDGLAFLGCEVNKLLNIDPVVEAMSLVDLVEVFKPVCLLTIISVSRSLDVSLAGYMRQNPYQIGSSCSDFLS